MNQVLLSTLCGRKSAALAGSLAALFTLVLPPLMRGQSMDYGALQQLFREPVTTSVNGSPQRVSDVPATMVIITAEDIRRSGAKDIPGVLRHVGGIDTLEWGNDNVDVGVRGYDTAYSSRLLVLVDGRQVYSDNFGFTPWSSIAVELGAIRQIEVIKGPNSALFGFNAVGGVINIITYNPLYDDVNTVSSTGGTQDLGAGSAVATHRFGNRAALRISVGGHSDSDFSTPVPAPEAVGAREPQYRGAIDINSVIRLNDKMLLGIEASQADTRLSEMQPIYRLGISHYTSNSFKGQLTVESGIGLLQATMYTNWLRDIANLGGDEFFDFKSRVTVAEVHDIFKLGADHTLRAAVEYRNSNESSTPVAGANISDDVLSAGGMWSWKITPTISLTNALRLDQLWLHREGFLPLDYPLINSAWNRTFTEPSFNSGLVWQPDVTDSIRLLVSRGAQLPSTNTTGAFLIDAPFLKFTGIPSLKPSVVTNYEIGWDRVLGGSHTLLRVSAFHQNNTNLIGFAGGFIPTPSGGYSTTTNVGTSYANGLELELKGTSLQKYRWSVSYRPEWISDHFVITAQNSAAYVDDQHTTPRHLLKANLGWTGGRWEIDSYLQYHSSVYGLQPTATAATLIPVAGFVSVDGRVGYNLTRWATWSISGQNLTHASQIQTSGPAVERRVLGTMSIRF